MKGGWYRSVSRVTPAAPAAARPVIQAALTVLPTIHEMSTYVRTLAQVVFSGAKVSFNAAGTSPRPADAMSAIVSGSIRTAAPGLPSADSGRRGRVSRPAAGLLHSSATVHSVWTESGDQRQRHPFACGW